MQLIWSRPLWVFFKFPLSTWWRFSLSCWCCAVLSKPGSIWEWMHFWQMVFTLNRQGAVSSSFVFILLFTCTCLPPAVGRGLVRNVEVVEILQILLQADSFTALFQQMKDVVHKIPVGHKLQLLSSAMWSLLNRLVIPYCTQWLVRVHLFGVKAVESSAGWGVSTRSLNSRFGRRTW